MTNLKQQFTKGQEYKIKLTFKKRAVTKTFDKLHSADGVTYEAYIFDGVGGTIFITDEHIESIEEVKPKAQKQKPLKVCKRCNGAKRFEHLKHVDNGVCYECGGTGTTY